MKTKSTLLKMALVVLFMMFGATTFAQTASYTMYICEGSSAVLTGVTPGANESLRWTENVGGTDILQTAGINGDKFTTPTSLSPGEHIFNLAIVTGDPTLSGCIGDKSADFKVYVLPPIVLALADATNGGTYCASNGTTTSAITATVTPVAGVPADVTYEFSWAVTKNTAGATNASVGTIANAATSSTFTMTTTADGTYAFTPTVKYVVLSNLNTVGNTKGCDQTVASKQVIVTPKPTAPTITIL